jgi:adenine phosphoribosyltransferase
VTSQAPDAAAGATADPELAAAIAAALRDVPDFPTPGILFKDIAPLLADGALFGACVNAFADNEAAAEADVIAGVEARGFIFAAALAQRVGAGMVPVRKAGKLPPPTVRASYALEYGVAEIEVPVNVLDGRRVYLLDDVLATGGTLSAAIDLLTSAGATVTGVGVVLELSFLQGRQRLTAAHAGQLTALLAL